jgi:hypothetical protein
VAKPPSFTTPRNSILSIFVFKSKLGVLSQVGVKEFVAVAKPGVNVKASFQVGS